jgi:hypothetical protein
MSRQTSVTTACLRAKDRIRHFLACVNHVRWHKIYNLKFSMHFSVSCAWYTSCSFRISWFSNCNNIMWRNEIVKLLFVLGNLFLLTTRCCKHCVWPSLLCSVPVGLSQWDSTSFFLLPAIVTLQQFWKPTVSGKLVSRRCNFVIYWCNRAIGCARLVFCLFVLLFM